MKRLTLLIVVTAMGLSAGESTEPASGVSFTYEATIASKYLWRGYAVNDSPSFQPSVTAEYRGLSVNLWSNFSKHVSHNQAWTETDISIEYARELGRLTLSAGFLEYRFPELKPEEGNGAEEVSLGVAVDAPLSPSFKYYRDISGGGGGYYYAGAERSFAVGRKGVRANLLFGAGVNQHLYQEQTTVSDVDVTFSVDLPKARVIWSPFVTCMRGHRTLFGSHAAFGVKFAFSR